MAIGMFKLLKKLSFRVYLKWIDLRINRRRKNIFKNSEELKAFEIWAFGKELDSSGMRSAMDIWNSLHGDKLMLKESDKVVESLKKMRKIWIQETKTTD